MVAVHNIGCIKNAALLRVPVFESPVSFSTNPGSLHKTQFLASCFWPILGASVARTDGSVPTSMANFFGDSILPGAVGQIQFPGLAPVSSEGSTPFFYADYFHMPFSGGRACNVFAPLGLDVTLASLGFASVIGGGFPVRISDGIGFTSRVFFGAFSGVAPLFNGSWPQPAEMMTTPAPMADAVFVPAAGTGGVCWFDFDLNNDYNFFYQPWNATTTHVAITRWKADDALVADQFRLTFSNGADDALLNIASPAKSVSLCRAGFLVVVHNHGDYPGMADKMYLIANDGLTYQEIALIPQTPDAAEWIANTTSANPYHIDPEGVMWGFDNRLTGNYMKTFWSFGFVLNEIVPLILPAHKPGITLPCFDPCNPDYLNNSAMSRFFGANGGSIV